MPGPLHDRRFLLWALGITLSGLLTIIGYLGALVIDTTRELERRVTILEQVTHWHERQGWAP